MRMESDYEVVVPVHHHVLLPRIPPILSITPLAVVVTPYVDRLARPPPKLVLVCVQWIGRPKVTRMRQGRREEDKATRTGQGKGDKDAQGWVRMTSSAEDNEGESCDTRSRASPLVPRRRLHHAKEDDDLQQGERRG